MLYDNAKLAGIYAAAYKLTGDTDYRRVTDEMLSFVSRELTAPDGGFYSSLDAETDGDEGQFYVWSRTRGVEGSRCRGRTPLRARLQHGGRSQFRGRCVIGIRTAQRPKQQASTPTRSSTGWTKSWRLLAAPGRGASANRRQDPHRLERLDDRRLRAGGHLLENDEYVRTATRAADFVLAKFAPATGVYGAIAQGHAQLNAYLDTTRSSRLG